MNLQLILPLVALLGLLLTFDLAPFESSSPSVYADKSETNTERGLSQENIGSGDAVNNNCSQNAINGDGALLCGGVSGSTPNQAFTVMIPIPGCVLLEGDESIRTLTCADVVIPSTLPQASFSWGLIVFKYSMKKYLVVSFGLFFTIACWNKRFNSLQPSMSGNN